MGEARDQVVAAMREAHMTSPPDADRTNALIAMLDAIPNDVLARYAIERGAFVEMAWDLEEDGPVPFYRPVTEG